MATLAPNWAKRTAMAWPIPELPPVTRTLRPFRPGMASVGEAVGAAVDMAFSPWQTMRAAVGQATPRGVTRPSPPVPRRRPLRLREEPLELVEAVHPAVAVQLAARLALEWTLPEHDLGGVAAIAKRQLDQILDVVGIWVLPCEREDQAGRRIDLAELPDEMEGNAVGRLHLDAVAVSDPGIEPEPGRGEARRPPPLRQLVRSAEGGERHRCSGGNDVLDLERQLPRRSPASSPVYTGFSRSRPGHPTLPAPPRWSRWRGSV